MDFNFDVHDPSATIFAVQIGAPGDPALARDAENAGMRLDAYAKSRSAEHLAALPLKGALRPWLFELKPIGMDELAHVYESTSSNALIRMDRAFRVSCHMVIAPDGTRHKAPMASAHEAAPAWSETVRRLRGLGVVQEMAALALRRAEVAPDAVDPYWPLAGAPRLAF